MRGLRFALLGRRSATPSATAAPSHSPDRRESTRRRGIRGHVPGALVLLADEHSGASRARKQTALIAALGGATAITALVGLAGHASDWRAAFVLASAVLLVLLLPSPVCCFPSSHSRRSSRARPAPASPA